MRVTLLGTGSSSGTPAIGVGWGRCDPNEPKNRRRRSGVYLETETTRILFDTSPDLRDHLLRHDINGFDAVLYTHSHADHAHGIDELRWICLAQKRDMPIYGDFVTLEDLKRKFGYCFEPLSEKSNGYYYKPVVIPHEIDSEFTNFSVKDLNIQPFEQDHGFSKSVGYRIGDFALSTDVFDLNDEAFEKLLGVKTWVLGCLQPDPHPTHIHIDKALEWFERIQPDQMIFTHMNMKMDYKTLIKELPKGVIPGYDGYSFEAN